jgi:hypothetical protein
MVQKQSKNEMGLNEQRREEKTKRNIYSQRAANLSQSIDRVCSDEFPEESAKLTKGAIDGLP